MRISVLDCTLRDGAYITDSKFGSGTITGIIKRLQDAKIEIIECGWLKDLPHEKGSSYYHVPDDLLRYIDQKNKNTTYVAMIDYNRYDIVNLPPNDGRTIDAIRVVFPKDKVKEGLALVDSIRDKGYRVFLQAANTLEYTDYEILDLISQINRIKPEAISIVDTFGAMYGEDLTRILSLFSNNLDSDIKIGLHSHNNLQLSFSLAIQFVREMNSSKREIIIDSSLCGMGRGAGNACTELITGFLNKKYYKDYNINTILDTIDVYMTQFVKKYEWGYSIPYYISGTYQSHVNNVAYLIKKHKTRARDLKVIIESLDDKKRRVYDYDNLEQKYISYMSREVDDRDAREWIKKEISGRKVIVIAPGYSAYAKQKEICEEIDREQPLVVGVNSLIPGYKYDYVFFSNSLRYDYAEESQKKWLDSVYTILTSNIEHHERDNIIILNYHDLINKKYQYFDNAMLLCLRLLDYCVPTEIMIAGFDGYDDKDNYFEGNMETNISADQRNSLNCTLKEMMDEYIDQAKGKYDVVFVTESRFER